MEQNPAVRAKSKKKVELAMADREQVCGPCRVQNNVQGNCDMGGMAEFYPGYKRALDPKSVVFFEAARKADDLSLGPGLTSTEMTRAALG